MAGGEIFTQYMSMSMLFVVPSLSIAIGQGLVANATMEAMQTQPQAAAAMRRTFVLGIAYNETAAILTGIMVIMLILQASSFAPAASYGLLGIVCALAIPSACVGILSSLPQQAAVLATARQPFFAREIMRLMLITISVMQTSIILGFILSLLMKSQLASAASNGPLLLASGVAFGFGSIGPLIGLGLFSQAACATIGTNRQIYPQVVSFTFICQGLIEAPILFSLVVALLIISGVQHNLWACFAAACTSALSTLGPGIASGRIAHAACMAMGKQPASAAVISRMSLLAQTLIDTSPVYGLVVALALLLFA